MNQFWPHTVESNVDRKYFSPNNHHLIVFLSLWTANLTRSITIVSKSTHSLGKLSIFPIFQQYFIFFNSQTLYVLPLCQQYFIYFQLANFVFLIFKHFFIFQFCNSFSPLHRAFFLWCPAALICTCGTFTLTL